MQTGFPSPAQGYEEKTIDLNSLLITHPSSTVFMRIGSSRYTRMGVYNGDLLIIDRALKVNKETDHAHRQLLVIEKNGRFSLAYTELLFNSTQPVYVCGVVTYVIHKTRNQS